MSFLRAVEVAQKKINKTILITAAAALIAGGFFMPKVFGAGGGDHCADGIPDASFLVSPGTKHIGQSYEVSFDGSYSQACDTPIVSYDWDFGDGSSATGATASHTYGVGAFSASLTITDEEGLTNTHTYYQNIIVKADNQDPVFSDSSFTVAQGSSGSYDASASANDPDGDSLPGGFYGPDGAFEVHTDQGTAYFQRSGKISFYADSSAEGSASFNVRVDDGFGGSDTAVVTVNIDPRLTAVDDYAQTYPNTPVVINAAANDVAEPGRTFAITWHSYGVTGGYIVNNSDGTLTFHPNIGVGSYSFEYYISTNDGGTYYGSYGTVNVDVVTPPNSAPSAVQDSLEVDEDTSGSVNITGNDSDPDGDSFSASITGGPSNGNAALSGDGTLNYTPNANYNGSDSVTYKLTDSKGNISAPATVAITVKSINDLPVAANDSANLNEDSAANINVLANDNDIESNSLSAGIVSGPSHGTLTQNPDNTFTYTPNANYNGNDSFVYSANDSDGGSAQAAVSITVQSVNDAPTASFTALLGSGGNANFNAGASGDIDGQIVSYYWNFGDGSTATTAGPTTTHKYKGKGGPYTVTLRVTDNNGATATYTRSVGN